MLSWKWVRWGGIAGVFAGVLYAVQTLPLLVPAMFDPRTLNEKPLDSSGDYLREVFLGAASAVELIFFVGLFALHTGLGRHRYGRLGRVGFLAAIIGSVLVIIKMSLIVAVGSAFGSQAVLDIEGLIIGIFLAGGLSVMAGQLVLGIATLQARVLPRWFGLALVLVPFVGIALLGIALGGYGPLATLPLYVAMGLCLWSYGTREEPVSPVEPQPAVVK